MDSAGLKGHQPLLSAQGLICVLDAGCQGRLVAQRLLAVFQPLPDQLNVVIQTDEPVDGVIVQIAKTEPELIFQ